MNRVETKKGIKSCSLCEVEFPQMTPVGFEMYSVRFVRLITHRSRFLVVIVVVLDRLMTNAIAILP